MAVVELICSIYEQLDHGPLHSSSFPICKWSLNNSTANWTTVTYYISSSFHSQHKICYSQSSKFDQFDRHNLPAHTAKLLIDYVVSSILHFHFIRVRMFDLESSWA